MDNFLTAIGKAFTSLAPFCLGLSLVGKGDSMRGQNLVRIFILIMIKCLLSAVLNKVEEGVKKTISIASGQSKSQRHIDPEKVEEVDFQCTVCLR